MQIDVYLYQEKARLRTEIQQLETLIYQEKIIVKEQVEILQEEIKDKKIKSDVIDYLIRNYRLRQYQDLIDRSKYYGN